MTVVIILATILATYFGLYWLISMEIKDHKHEIMNKLKLIEKQNNMIREDINELRSQVESVWVNTQVIKDYTRPEENDTGTKRKKYVIYYIITSVLLIMKKKIPLLEYTLVT